MDAIAKSNKLTSSFHAFAELPTSAYWESTPACLPQHDGQRFGLCGSYALIGLTFRFRRVSIHGFPTCHVRLSRYTDRSVGVSGGGGQGFGSRRKIRGGSSVAVRATLLRLPW